MRSRERREGRAVKQRREKLLERRGCPAPPSGLHLPCSGFRWEMERRPLSREAEG